MQDIGRKGRASTRVAIGFASEYPVVDGKIKNPSEPASCNFKLATDGLDLRKRRQACFVAEMLNFVSGC